MKINHNLVPNQGENLLFPMYHQERHQSHTEIQEIRILAKSLLNKNKDLFPKKLPHWRFTLCRKS